MRVTSLVAFSTALLLGGTAFAQAPDAPPPAYRSGVDMVGMTVTVRNADGSFAQGLGVDRFHVYENGVEQPIAVFGAGDVPLDLVLLLDASASMTPRLAAAQHAANILIASLAEADRAAVFSVSDRTTEAVPLTNDLGRLTQAIAHVRGGGSTPLYDAMYIALQQVDGDAGSAPRRRALVVLSDGEDTSSHVPFDTVKALALRAGVSVYTVMLPSRMNAILRDQRFSDATFTMRSLAHDTGAQAFSVAPDENLDSIYTSIARELRSQYSVGYVAGRHPRGAFVPVRVVVTGPVGAVRTRTGYMVGRGESAGGPK